MLKSSGAIGMFKLFAELIAFHLDAGQQLAEAQASLLDARNVGELRDRFIAVLGHDLRNPLGSIAAGTRLLRGTPQSERALAILAMKDRSVFRIAGLTTSWTLR
jgi:signal transduction histidine kinase